MEEQKKILKDDINFLEYPTWVIDRKNKATIWKLEKPHGKYEILCPLGLPKHFDKIVVYFLLYKLYKEKDLETYTLSTNRYEIAKNIFGGSHFSKNTYDRIMSAIRKWKAISINFEGVFFEGDTHTIRGFSIVDEYVLRKATGELSIRFSEGYIKQLKESKFYKLIDFEQYKKLHKTSSARLYEILVKNFKERNEWAINLQALAEKITFEKREGAKDYYPSDVLRYLKPSINEINKKTDLSIHFQFNNETSVCIFKKVEKQKPIYIPAKKETNDSVKKKATHKKQMTACLDYFKSLEDEKREYILEDIKRQPFLVYLPDQDSRIFAYMTQNKLWQLADN